MKTLYPIQQKAVEMLSGALSKHKAAINASDVGTGKTLVSVELAKSLNLKVLVVCPKIVIPSWHSTFEEQGAASLVIDVVNYEKLVRSSTPYGKWQSRGFRWSLPDNTLVIFDEAHRCKSRTSRTAELLKSIRTSRINKWADLKVLMLSATLAENPTEMWACGYVLRLHNSVNYTEWLKSLGCKKDVFGSWNFPLKSHVHLEKLRGVLYPEYGCKIHRADLAEFFSETTVNFEPLQLDDSKDIQEAYDEMEAELALLAETSSKDHPSAHALVTRLRARQKVELLKIPTFVDLAKHYMDSGCSVVVFFNFKDSMEAFTQRLGKVPSVRVEGGQSAEARHKNIEAFQRNEVRLLVANISAGGVGVSLHDLHGDSPRVALLSPQDNAKEMLQVLGRIDRAGAKSDTLQRVLITKGTVEEEIARNMSKKIKEIQTLHNTTIDMSEQPKHAEFGPSSLKHFEICPSYKGRSGTNPSAERGTRIHDALEKDDTSGLQSPLEHEMYDACQDALAQIFNIHNFRRGEYGDYREVRFQIELRKGLSTFGTNDLIAIKGDVGIQVDWKTGVGKIDDAEVNCQAQAYVLGAFQHYKTLNTIHFYFVVPQRDEVLYATYTRDQIPALQLRLGTIVTRASHVRDLVKKGSEVPVEFFNPQPGTCDYCSNQINCRALNNKVLSIASKYSEDGYELPENLHSSQTDSPEDLAKMLKLVPIVESWAKSVKEHSRLKMLEEGIDIPGFEIKERRASKSIASLPAAISIAKDFGINEDQVLDAVGPISFNAVAELVYQNAPARKKTSTKADFEVALRSCEAIIEDSPTQYISKIRA